MESVVTDNMFAPVSPINCKYVTQILPFCSGLLGHPGHCTVEVNGDYNSGYQGLLPHFAQ